LGELVETLGMLAVVLMRSGELGEAMAAVIGLWKLLDKLGELVDKLGELGKQCGSRLRLCDRVWGATETIGGAGESGR
jgi:hypothetical protein